MSTYTSSLTEGSTLKQENKQIDIIIITGMKWEQIHKTDKKNLEIEIEFSLCTPVSSTYEIDRHDKLYYCWKWH